MGFISGWRFFEVKLIPLDVLCVVIYAACRGKNVGRKNIGCKNRCAHDAVQKLLANNDMNSPIQGAFQAFSIENPPPA
jgi:hypothetical protein